MMTIVDTNLISELANRPARGAALATRNTVDFKHWGFGR
jgi:hypothetical protein